MIMIMKTSGSQVDSPVAEGKRKEGGGRKIEHRESKEKSVNRGPVRPEFADWVALGPSDRP